MQAIVSEVPTDTTPFRSPIRDLYHSGLRRYLRSDRILIDLKARKKEAAIRELTSLLEPEVPDLRRFLSSLLQKEARFGSAVEKGVAIPHYRDDWVSEPVVCLGISREGIAFGNAPEPVHILVLIAWPLRHHQVYLKTVGELAWLFHNTSVRRLLMLAESSEEALEILSQ
ncbi:MAG: PTS sugar transporter subunit IIA [bacterium]|nr:PTS sugar transporter subunit IIA [bacterium]